MDFLKKNLSNATQSIKDAANSVAKSTSEITVDTTKSIKGAANSIAESTSEITDSVTNSVSNFTNSIKEQLFSASQSEETIYDTTYYFLIPDILNAGEYILHTHCEIPANIIDESKLEKRRIFHLPNEESFQILKNKFLEEKSEELKNDTCIQNDMANILNSVANSIDTTNSLISGGLFTVGAIACVVNPVAGISVLASSLAPHLLSDVVNGVTKGVSSKLKLNSDKNRTEEANKKALNDLKAVEPETHINFTLMKIDNCLKDKNYCALTDISDQEEDLRLVSGILTSMYEDKINETGFFKKYSFNDNLINYYETIKNRS